MASLNVFRQDAFSMITMTEAIERVPYLPTGIGELGLFLPEPIRTSRLWLESRQGQLMLIPFSERGTVGKERVTETREGFTFKVPRLMAEDTITATELQDVRAFGSETEMMQVETEVARRLSGPVGLQASMENTREFLRLGAVQGYMVDPGNPTQVLKDFAAEFGVARPAEIAFNLPAGTPNSLRPLVNGIVRQIARAAQGMPVRRIFALCGDAFYDSFVNHPDVIRTFVNWEEAKDLRGSQGAAFSSFEFGGVLWVNYRGTNDNSTIAIPTDKVKFFADAPGLFRCALSPAEFLEYVGTPGKEEYVLPIMDKDRNAWWKMELYSYPLFYCSRPETLLTGRMEA